VRIGAQRYLATFSFLDAIPRRFGQLCRIVILAWLFRVMGRHALQRKNALLAQLRHPLLQGVAGV